MGGKGIAIAGSIVVDSYFLIDTYPKQGNLVTVKEKKVDIGGSGNLIVGLAKLDPSLQVKVSIFKEENIYKALHKLKKLGVTTWAIIHSPSCSYGLDCQNETYHKVKSLELPPGYIKGTTGAGDAFCCGVLYAAYMRQGIKEGMELGCACAACSLSEVSGTAGMRSYKEVRDSHHSHQPKL